MKINIIGSFLGSDGYTSHSKGLANALYDKADCKIVTQLAPEWEKHVTDAEFDMITKPERKEDWNIIITIPHMWKMFLGQGKNACYCVWEGDKIPESWIDDMLNQKVNLILVPSEHTKDAIMNTVKEVFEKGWSFKVDCIKVEEFLIEDKIRIIPHGVDRKIFYSQKKLITPVEQTADSSKVEKVTDNFNFLCNKGWRGTFWDRGGVQYLLQAFAEEFSKDEKVELTIKLNPAYINPPMIEQSFNSLNLPENRPPIKIISDLLIPDKLNKLYNSADCFVCCTRAESFNLPGLEAMSSGLPTIQTNFGGQADYMNDNNSLFIDFDLVESEEKPAYEGIKWAIPKIESIKKQLRWAFENQDKIKEMGKSAEEDAKQFTWENSANLLLKELKK